MALINQHSINVLTQNPRIPCESFTYLLQKLWHLTPIKCLDPNRSSIQFQHISRVSRLNNLTFALKTHDCKLENTPQKIIQSVRKYALANYLDPHEILTASCLHHSHLSLLHGRIPRDPNLKALAIIMETISYPGEFTLNPVASHETKSPTP